MFAALFKQAPEPQRLGRYVVLDTLGQGGMGVVLRAYDRELDRQVALKVLHDLDDKHTTRLRREAQALAKLSHPNVVQVYEVGEIEGQTFVAMELVKGRTATAWMQQAPRPDWRACVTMFIQLGAGLAAAHQRGLVHRDFKPGNAIIDDEGRPRVLDFGLARQGEKYVEGEDPPSAIQRVRTAEHEPVSLDVSLTNPGAVLGTPAYMPPEQMAGLAVDARSDQFSFCVSLYEAVYGERPYEGTSMMALMVSMRSGVVRPPPKRRNVPVALRKVLLRGLSVDPVQRWPAMEALLGELRRLVAQRSRAWWALGLTGGLTAVGGGVAYEAEVERQAEHARQAELARRCSGARARLDGIWDEGRRQELRGAILGTKLSYAPDTWERVEPHLDAYAEAWANDHTETCEASTVRGEQSPAVMDLRMGCLHERRTHLRATVNVLAQADATVVENAVMAVEGLPGLSRCADVAALAAEIPPPEDPAVAERVAQLQDQLVEAKVKLDTGKYAEGLVVAAAVVAAAKTLDYEPLMARAWLRQGNLRTGVGDYEEAVTTLRQAYDAAVARRMTAEAADAAIALVHVVGYSLARYDDAWRWAVDADPLSRAVGVGETHARYLDSVGAVAQSQGKLDEARGFYERALAIKQETLGPRNPHVATSLNNLGSVADAQGKLDEARGFHERALAIFEQALGSQHPHVAASLNNLGAVASAQGKLDDARGFHERALAIKQALGPEHPEVATALNNLAAVAEAEGKLDEARVLYERALAIREEGLGPEHPEVATTLNNLAGVAFLQSKLDEAHGLLERALTIREQTLGPHHHLVAASLNSLGAVAQSQGKLDEARVLYARALTGFEQALGPQHPYVAGSLYNLGNVAEAQGELDEARDFHERALAINEKALGPDHPAMAASLDCLGRVAEAQGKLDEAHDSYERALAIREQALGPDHPDIAYSLTGLGELLLARSKPAEALAPLERALVLGTTHEVDPLLLAATRFALAGALWAVPITHGRDRPRARALAEQARDAYIEHGAGAEKERAEAEAWLAKHRLR